MFLYSRTITFFSTKNKTYCSHLQQYIRTYFDVVRCKRYLCVDETTLYLASSYHKSHRLHTEHTRLYTERKEMIILSRKEKTNKWIFGEESKKRK